MISEEFDLLKINSAQIFISFSTLLIPTPPNLETDRVKSLLSNQECLVEVSDIDTVILGIIASTADLTRDDHILDISAAFGVRCDKDAACSPRPESLNSDGAVTVVSDEEIMRMNNDREKTIFLRAALQLLDEENNAASAKYKMPPSDNTDNHEKLRAIYNTADFFRGKSKLSSTQERVPREDNIRFGWLKKASKSGTFASVSSVWKAKFVELRHGYFCYEDDFSGTKKAVKKNIALSMDVCYCQVIKMREKDGDCVFELSMRGGSRRLWQAASIRDRDAWILAINMAMTKSPQRFLEPSRDSLTNASKNSMRTLLEQSVCTVRSHSSYSSATSSDGAAAPYADEISRYCAIMHVIKSVESVESYRHIIDQLRGVELSITIPVFFVKVRTCFHLQKISFSFLLAFFLSFLLAFFHLCSSSIFFFLICYRLPIR
jgi:PH domain